MFTLWQDVTVFRHLFFFRPLTNLHFSNPLTWEKCDEGIGCFCWLRCWLRWQEIICAKPLQIFQKIDTLNANFIWIIFFCQIYSLSILQKYFLNKSLFAGLNFRFKIIYQQRHYNAYIRHLWNLHSLQSAKGHTWLEIQKRIMIHQTSYSCT